MGGRSGVEERPWPQRSYNRISVRGLLGRERMDSARGIRLIHGVEPPCMRIARRMGFSSAPWGLEEAVSGMLERR